MITLMFTNLNVVMVCCKKGKIIVNTVETILCLWKVIHKNYAVLLKFLRQPYTNNLIF